MYYHTILPSNATISDARQSLAKVEVWDTNPCIVQLNCWPAFVYNQRGERAVIQFQQVPPLPPRPLVPSFKTFAAVGPLGRAWSGW